jgi:hypothetical protein
MEATGRSRSSMEVRYSVHEQCYPAYSQYPTKIRDAGIKGLRIRRKATRIIGETEAHFESESWDTGKAAHMKN